jgi:hypothetical protein
MFANTSCGCAVLQRDATAAIARRQQWQTIPIEDCPRTLQTAMQEPCNEVSRAVSPGICGCYLLFC